MPPLQKALHNLRENPRCRTCHHQEGWQQAALLAGKAKTRHHQSTGEAPRNPGKNRIHHSTARIRVTQAQAKRNPLQAAGRKSHPQTQEAGQGCLPEVCLSVQILFRHQGLRKRSQGIKKEIVKCEACKKPGQNLRQL